MSNPVAATAMAAAENNMVGNQRGCSRIAFIIPSYAPQCWVRWRLRGGILVHRVVEVVECSPREGFDGACQGGASASEKPARLSILAIVSVSFIWQHSKGITRLGPFGQRCSARVSLWPSEARWRRRHPHPRRQDLHKARPEATRCQSRAFRDVRPRGGCGRSSRRRRG